MSEENAAMSADRHMPNESCVRRAPLCYSRTAASPAISQSNVDKVHSGVLLSLTIITSLAVFLLAYSGWSL